MLRIQKLENQLNRARFIQLILMYITSLLVFILCNIPHSIWIVLTVAVASVTIHPGLMILRSVHLLKGTLCGLLIAIPLMDLLQLNGQWFALMLIFIFLCLRVSRCDLKRYDISACWITLAMIFTFAQSLDVQAQEGPAELLINRLMCSLIGVLIVLLGDYFLFHSFQYSRKLYDLHQLRIFLFFKKTIQQFHLCAQESMNESHTPPKKRMNRFVLVQSFRKQINVLYVTFLELSKNLKLDLRTDPVLIQKINACETYMMHIRLVLFGLCFSSCIVYDPNSFNEKMKQYHILLHAARRVLLKPLTQIR